MEQDGTRIGLNEKGQGMDDLTLDNFHSLKLIIK
jgi:hypothetical protein